MPVYGTAIRMQAMIFSNMSSLKLLSKTSGSISSACLTLGTLIVVTHAVHRLQVLRMHEKTGKPRTYTFETEQHAKPHIVDPALHRTVHRFRVVIVIVFSPGRMQLQIALPVVRFLK